MAIFSHFSALQIKRSSLRTPFQNKLILSFKNNSGQYLCVNLSYNCYFERNDHDVLQTRSMGKTDYSFGNWLGKN